MSTSEAIATELFYRIRQRCDVGMREYLAAIEAIRGGYEQRLPLKQILQMLWCHSQAEQLFFETQWDAAQEILSSKVKREAESEKSSDASRTDNKAIDSNPSNDSSTPTAISSLEEKSIPNLSYEGFRVDSATTSSEEELELGLYFPVSRRTMIYLWRFLRRPVADGVADVLDIAATVDRAARQGYYWQPVMRRRVSNRAHLLLLVDRGGSMTPCHRFAEDIVETAVEDGQFGRVDVFYFYNVPTGHVYKDDRLTQPIELDLALEDCDRDTSVLIVSDGGAARGYRTMQRLEQTRKFLLELQKYSHLIGWLNPIPKERWHGSSAEFLAYLVPMQEMSNDGMGQLIDVIKGTSLSHLQGVG